MEKLSNLLEIDNKTVEPNPEEYYEYYTVPNYGEENFPYQEKGSNIQSSKNVVMKGHLLVCKINPRISRIFYLNKDSSITQIASTEFMPFVINEQRLFPKYVEMFLKTPQVKSFFQSRATGTSNSHKRMKSKDVLDLQIPLPPINIQKEIAEKLSTASSLIEEREKANHLTNKLLQAVFFQMFGDPTINPKKWELKTLPELVVNKKYAIKRGPFGGSLKKEFFTPTGYLVYEQYHAINNDFSKNRYFISEKKYRKLEMFKVVEGDLIISCSGVTLGRIAEVPKGAPYGIINQALLKISLDRSKMNTTFFMFLFRSRSIQEVLFRISRGSGQPNLPPMTEMKAIKFLTPPIELQNDFASLIEKLEKIRQKQDKSAIELSSLFDSLMSKAFKCELVC